jgi:hypothetical protein
MNFADIERTINEFGEKVNENFICKSRKKKRFSFF